MAMAIPHHVVDLQQPQQQQQEELQFQHESALEAAIADVAECRSKLRTLGDPPDHDSVHDASLAISAIDSDLSSQLERLVLAPTPPGMDRKQWRSLQAQKEHDLREAARVAKIPHQAIMQLDELHRSYERLLRNAEEDMVKLSSMSAVQISQDPAKTPRVEEHVNEEVVRVLQAAEEGPLEEVDLKGRRITYLPDVFGKISTIITLDLSNNQLEVLSDSIGGLINLQTFNLENNDLVALPDSMGLLKNLQILNVSENKLSTLPESILQCSSLVSLTANLNQLTYLPSQIGFSLLNLQRLSVQWNKLRSLPASVCNLKSLKCLEVRFNQLKSLPSAIGNLTNLEILDASCNFMDLQVVPDSVGDLVSLIDLNLSCNQIRVLPDSFGRLQNLKKINIHDNPLAIPPMEIVDAGVEEIMAYMKGRWQNYLEEEEKRQSAQESPKQSKWLPWVLGGSWFTKKFPGVSDERMSSRWQDHGSEDYLEQQL